MRQPIIKEEHLEVKRNQEQVEQMEQESITKVSKKRLIGYLAETTLVVILCILFFKYTWVRWSLLLYIPWNIFNLSTLIRDFLHFVRDE